MFVMQPVIQIPETHRHSAYHEASSIGWPERLSIAAAGMNTCLTCSLLRRQAPSVHCGDCYGDFRRCPFVLGNWARLKS